MKRIIICRHAKSSWESLHITDKERPLNQKGIDASNKMGAFLKAKNYSLPIFISSPANRTISTAKIIENYLAPLHSFIIENKFYNFDDQGNLFLEYVSKLKEETDTVFIFGHNDTCLMNVMNLSKGEVLSFPTGSTASFIFDVNDWSELNKENAQVEFIQYPKELN